MRLSFDAHFNRDYAAITVASCAVLAPSELDRIVRMLNSYGFVVVSHESNNEDRGQLLALRKILGKVVNHKRSDHDGVATVTPSSQFPGYYGTSSNAHPAHTDGAFGDAPPRFVALQCVVQATNGGYTQLASGAGIYQAIATASPTALEALFHRDALTVCRDKEMSRAPVFTRHGPSIHIRFRDDSSAAFRADAATVEGISLVRHYVLNPQNILEFALEQRQILLLDNRGVLHGRTEFNPSNNRLLLRATFDGGTAHALGLVNGFSGEVTAPHESTRAVVGSASGLTVVLQ
jgi:gamma-butyrobetaine dioxygenase